jgi:hypothetical protein
MPGIAKKLPDLLKMVELAVDGVHAGDGLVPLTGRG